MPAPPPTSRAVDRVFLRACAAAGPQDWSGQHAGLRALDAGEWRGVVAQAVDHGLVGLVGRSLEWAQAETGIAIAAVGPLAELRRGQLVQQLQRKAAARRAADGLARRGIPFIAFKGVALAEEIYGDLSLRGFRDFDVMVPLERLDEAYAALFEMGYRLPRFGHPRDWLAHGAHAVGMAHADGSGVDLHWAFAPDVLDAGRVAMIWSHAREAPRGAHLPGLRLSTEMSLVHFAKHFHSHQYGEIKPLLDFYVTARTAGAGVDAAGLAAAARAMDLLPVVRIALRLCERSFIAGHLAALEAAKGPSIQAAIAARVVSERFLVNATRLPRISNWLRYLAAAGGARATLKGALALLFPNRLTLTQFFDRQFQASMYPAYYWRQLVKVVTFASERPDRWKR